MLNLHKTYSTEAALTKAVKKYLDSRDDLMYRKVSDRYQRGISDILVCVQGRFVALELKDDTGKASPHQKLFIKQVVDAGGVAVVCRTLHDVVSALEAALEK